MCAQPIWASRRDPEWLAARAAGWSRAELAWERLQETAHDALAAGETARARRRWRLAALIARWRFGLQDLRRATSQANLGFAARLAGDDARAARHYGQAQRIWRHAPAMISAAQVAPRSRSSLFHMRMELRHAGTFRDNLEKRLGAFAHEIEGALADLGEGRQPSVRLASRWRAEKPPVFDDTRRFLAAALLIAGETSGPSD